MMLTMNIVSVNINVVVLGYASKYATHILNGEAFYCSFVAKKS